MKVLKRFFIVIAAGILLVVVILLLLTSLYEDNVKQFFIDKLNANLKTKVIVDSKDIHLSLIKNFPYAALSFSNIVMVESPIQKFKTALPGTKEVTDLDTLFSAHRISLQFNILNIISKNYEIKKIVAKDGMVKFRKGIDGSVNWDIWKKATDSLSDNSSGNSVFNLKKFQLENIRLFYNDYLNTIRTVGIIKNGVAAGEFSSRNYNLSVKGDLSVDYFKVDSINYLDHKPVMVNLNLLVDQDKEIYQFNNSSLNIADILVIVEGKYIHSTPAPQVDVFLRGKNMDIESVLSLLPEKYKRYVHDYESDGELYCNIHISGVIDEKNGPAVKADFGITKADIMQLSSGIILKDAHLLGDYLYSPWKTYLRVKSFSARLKNGQVAGSVAVEDFASPQVAANLKGNMLIEDVRQLLKIDTIWNFPVESFSGIIKLNMDYKGRLNNSGKYRKSDFEKMILSGDMTLEKAGMKINNSALHFDSVYSFLTLHDNNIVINSFYGKTLYSDFYLKGILNNVLGYTFSDNNDLNVETTFKSNNLNLNEFLLNQKESSKRDTVYRVNFSPRISLAVSTDIGHLSFRRFEAHKMKGMMVLRNQKLIMDPLSFQTMDGVVSATGMIDGKKQDSLLVTCDARISNLNISKLFYQFEDFGQQVMTYKHLKGFGTATIQFASVLKSDLDVDPNKIYVRSDMSIEQGELMNFSPINALSKYISLSELQDIKFSTLQNKIEIKERKVFIPKMDIKSNALDVTLSGTHNFNNNIDYHFKLLLSDILFQKARRAKKENEEFGVVEDDKKGGVSLFISMGGTIDNPIFKYDRQQAKQNFKENIASEKQSVKQVLKDEFGWFKKDTSVKKTNKPKEDDKFIIKWDEDEKKEKSKEKDDDF